MGYKCRECGNEDSFYGTQNVTQYGSERVRFDGEGSINDWLDTQIDDSDSDGGFYELECCECGSENIDDNYDEDDEPEERTLKSLLEVEE